MTKLHEDLRIALLGAAAGLFSSSVVLMIDRIDRYYAYLSSIETETNPSCYSDGFRELWWLPVAFWHVVLAVVASFLVHRYLTKRIALPFLLWQAVGLTTVFGWGLSVALVVGLQCVVNGDLEAVERLATLTARDAANIAKYVSVVFACNVFYGSVIDASSRQYVEQFESD